MAPYEVQWGILATGDNALKFAKDLLIPTQDPDIKHNLVGVASSTSLSRASSFLSSAGAASTSTPYGSYAELLANPSISIVYIASPHSHHFQHALQALHAGKAVLLEKAFTMNAAQARILVALAKEKKLFLMEALWTRFMPVSERVKQLIADGIIGSVGRVVADRSLGRDIEKLYGTTHRLINKDLAGGALLDLAIYPLTWIFQILPHDPTQLPHIASALIKYPPTGVDESASIIVTFFESSPTQGIATASLRITGNPAGPDIRIISSKGEIQIFGPAARPTHFQLVDTTGSELNIETEHFPMPEGAHGLLFEADACGRYLRDGVLESPIMPLQETVLLMDVLDTARAQTGLVYAEELESTAV